MDCRVAAFHYQPEYFIKFDRVQKIRGMRCDKNLPSALCVRTELFGQIP